MENTRLDSFDNHLSECEQDTGIADTLIILSGQEDEYQAKFSIELDGILRPAQAEHPAEAPLGILSEVALVRTLLNGLGDGQEITFHYSWHGETANPAFSWQVVGATTGENSVCVLDQARELFDSIQFALGDAARGAYSWTPSHRVGSWDTNHSHQYSIRPDWISIAAVGGATMGFTGARLATNKVLLPHPVGGTGDRLDSIIRIGKTGFGEIAVTVKASRVKLSDYQLKTIAAAVRQLNNGSIGHDVLETSNRVPILDERLIASTIGRLEQWLNSPAGYMAVCSISANKPVPKSILATIGSQLFPAAPLLMNRIEERTSHESTFARELDLSTCFHQSERPLSLLPCTNSMESVGIRRVYVAPPPIMSKDGLLIGRGGKSGQTRQIRISNSDRSRHCYVLGGTGTGKSTLLSNMITQDIDNGEGLCLIDPHGDLYEQVLESIPKHRVSDVIALNLADPTYSVGINFLECLGPNRDLESNFVVNELMSIFGRLYDLKVVGGPIFEMYMRNALLAILGVEGRTGTLLDVVQFFESRRFRKYILATSNNTMAASFYTQQAAAAAGDLAMNNVAPYITAKLNQFTHNAMLRPIIGQRESTVNFRTAMDDGKIVLINLAKGTLGEQDASLLGMLLVGKIFNAALSRDGLDVTLRRPFYLYIDEFQNMATPTAVALLSEARKFGLSLIMANQHLAQLSDDSKSRGLVQAILGNVATLLAFRTGPEDAHILGSYTKPQVHAGDLQNLPNFHIACRMINNNNPVPPFVFQTYPRQELVRSTGVRANIAKDIQERGRSEYLRPRDEVNKAIMQLWSETKS